MANITHRPEQGTSTQPYGTYGNRDPFRMMREMFRWDPFRDMGGFPSEMQGFSPSFDVKEKKDALIIQADLPGVTEKDVAISITGNRLTISGERQAEETKDDENYFMFERTYGSFSRSFTLPEDVHADQVQAELKNGVLRLTLPKKPEAQSKRVEVRAGR